jgi:SAM-dependent methyltransferase
LKFRDSELAHRLLDGKKGIEIGAAAHNPFNIPDCKFVDRTDDPNDIYKQGSLQLCDEILPVDFVMEGDDLWMFPDNTWDYVLSSHVLEHFFDPVKAVEEWLRVVKPGGYVFMIIPKWRSLPGEDRDCTTLQEIRDRHDGKVDPKSVYMGAGRFPIGDKPMDDEHGHWTVMNLPDFINIADYYGWKLAFVQETDDKVGNGFTVVLMKR